MMVSAIMNFQASRFSAGNDLPQPLHLPTFAATSWYHGQLDKKYNSLENLLTEVEEFAMNDYTLALMKGDQLSSEERKRIIDKLHDYTGVSKSYLDDSNLRLFVGRFNKELLRHEGKTVGRLDSRFTGHDYDDAGERYSYDPSYNEAIFGCYTACINDHLRNNLKEDNPITYEILTRRVRPWDYSNVENQYLNVSETLREAMTKNRHLKVWIANGYYDMATAYFATKYTVDHMFLRPELKKNITQTYYEAGHMMYIHMESLIKFRKDFVEFMDVSD
jgi:carboxypeptidase C (cathepsin A)